MKRREWFWTTTSVLMLAAATGSALAQENEGSEDEGQFLGTLTLGSSKRAVQTDTATPLTVIEQTEIDDRQANTVAELIDSVPGVTLVNGSTPAGSGINIRGFGANGTFGTDQKVAIIVDGATTGGEELYRIGTQLFTDPYLYKSVEVIRGTVGSFEYGSGIVGGVVRLETKDASDFTGGEPGAALGVTLGAFSNGDTYNGSFTGAWQPTENLELLGNFSYREQNNQEDGDGNEIGNSALELPSYLLKGRYTAGAHSIMSSYTRTTTAERDVPYDTFFTTTDAFGNVDRDITSETLTAIYGFNPQGNDLINFEVAFAYANQEIDGTYIEGSSALESNPFFGPVVRALGDANHQFETTRITVRNEALLDTGPFAHRLRTGVEYIKRERAQEEAAPGGVDDRFALFLVDVIDFADGWTLSPALRYETSDIDGEPFEDAPFPGAPAQTVDVNVSNDALMGGVSLRYAFDNGLAFFGSWAHTENLPIIDDLENAVFIEQPEVAQTYELGFSYDRIGLFSDNDTLALKVNFYDTNLDDVTSYSGVEEVDLQGIEIESSLAFEQGFYVDFNANFTDGSQDENVGSDDDPVIRAAGWQNAPADNFRLTVGQRFGEVADLSYELVANQDYSLTAFSNTTADGSPAGPNGSLILADEQDGFELHNIRLTLTPDTPLLRGTQIRFGVENITNEQVIPVLATRPVVGRNYKFTISKLF
ncbi:MAG: TonB-dependent receptor [Pseudomonadota bacterium]